jgi:hypothetical protein
MVVYRVMGDWPGHGTPTIESDLSQSPHYFSGYERRFLESCTVPDQCGYSSSQLENRLEERFSTFDDRFQFLIDDLYLMTGKNPVDFDFEQMWDEITQVNTRFEKLDHYRGIASEKFRRQQNTIFAFELARGLREFCPPNKEDGLERLLWGFILGLIDSGTNNDARERQRFAHCLTFLVERFRARWQIVGRSIDQIDHYLSTIQSDDLLSQAFNKSNSFTEQIPELKSEALRRMKESDFEMTVENAVKIVDEMGDDSVIIALYHLDHSIRMDIRAIREKCTSAPHIIDSLNYLHLNSEALSVTLSSETANRTSPSLVSKHLKDLGKRSDTDRETTFEPVVERNNSGYWSLTTYGEILCTHLFERDFAIAWIYDFISNCSRLSDTEQNLIKDYLMDYSPEHTES